MSPTKIVLKNLIENTSILVHAAGITSIGEKKREAVHNTNVLGTEVVIEACYNKNIRLIYISSSNAITRPIHRSLHNDYV